MGRIVTQVYRIVSVPDPNQPLRRSLPVDPTNTSADCFQYTGSDLRWGWFGSGAETSVVTAKAVLQSAKHANHTHPSTSSDH